MGPTEALSLAFRVVLAVGAATSPANSNHRQVSSSPTIWWPSKNCRYRADRGEATCNFKLAYPRKGHASLSLECDESAVGKMLTLGDGPIPLQKKRALVRHPPCYVFPKTEPIRVIFETVSRVAGGL
jgi:hypothetical protein